MVNSIFKRVFGENRNDSELVFNSPLTQFVFNVAEGIVNGKNIGHDVWDDDDNSLEVLIETAMFKFHHLVEIFKRSQESKETFLATYDEWAGPCKDTIASLRAFAEEMQKDKFNSDIARVVGGVVGAIGGVIVGISFLTPLAAVTVPLAIGGGVASALGGGVVAGTTGTEIVLVKNKLEKAKILVEKEKEKFSAMAHWFTYPEEIENAINSLVDFDIVKEVLPEVQKFFRVSDHKKMTDQEFEKEFAEILEHCFGRMNNNNNLTKKYGKELAPVVMTFVFVVCLMQRHNRITLDCVLITQHMALGLMSVVDFGVLAGALLGKLAARGVASAVAKFAVSEILTCLGIIIDVLNVVFASIDLHKRPETKHVKKIKEVADKFEQIFLFIEGVYKATKKYKSPQDKSKMAAIIILNAPGDAVYKDFKTAVCYHLHMDAWRQMRIHKLKTKGNHWIVKVPETYSENMLKLTRLNIKGTDCEVTQ